MGFNLPEIKGDIVFESFPAGPLQCNCSIVGDPVTKRCVVVDPGGDPEKILAFVDENGLKVSAIIHTRTPGPHPGFCSDQTADRCTTTSAPRGYVPLECT